MNKMEMFYEMNFLKQEKFIKTIAETSISCEDFLKNISQHMKVDDPELVKKLYWHKEEIILVNK